ncbi:hypothetical protein MHI37_30300 [Paenibacillus sp. FSL H8-0548]|nr:hypothetical protein [Paenibacillus sp. FSL H8-0548]
MPDRPLVITTFADDRLVRLAAGTALLVIHRQGFDMKMIGSNK